MMNFLSKKRAKSACIDTSPPENFVVRFTVWQHGQRGPQQTNYELCVLVVGLLKQCYREQLENQNKPQRPMPWTVRPVPAVRGEAPLPIQVDISCHTSAFYTKGSTSEGVEKQHAHDLAENYLWKHFLRFAMEQKVQDTYGGYLLGFNMQHPNPTHDNNWFLSKCYLVPFDIPEPIPLACETEFYHGPAICLGGITDVLIAYEAEIRLLPAGFFPDPQVNQAIAAIQMASSKAPALRTVLVPVLEKLDRSGVLALVKQEYGPVVRYLGDTLAAIETLAVNTLTSEPTARDVITAIYALYRLKSSVPTFTSAMEALKDKKKQDAITWACVAAAAAGVIVLYMGTKIIGNYPVSANLVEDTRKRVTAAATSSSSSSVVTCSSAISAISSTGVLAGGLTAASAGTAGTGFVQCLYLTKEMGQVENMIIINKNIDEKIEHIVYYLVLCFMKSGGIQHPRGQVGDLEYAVASLKGAKPNFNIQAYSARHLHKLVREIAQEFNEVRASLIKSLKTPLQALNFTPRSEISPTEAVYRF